MCCPGSSCTGLPPHVKMCRGVHEAPSAAWNLTRQLKAGTEPVDAFDGPCHDVAGLLQVQHLLPVLCHQLRSLHTDAQAHTAFSAQ